LHVEHTAPEAIVEAFDEAVLHRTARLNEVQDDALALGPFGSANATNSGPLSRRSLAG